VNFPKKTINASSVTYATDSAKDYIQITVRRALDVSHDPRKVERLKKSECVFCFYIRTERIGGAAMTTQPCGLCEREMHFCSTNTDAICEDCSRANDLCKHCGADIKLRARRVFEPGKAKKGTAKS
jgi:hypothetical protein